MIEIYLPQNFICLVSDEDFERVSKYRWHTVIGGKTRYALRREVQPNGKRKLIWMHHFIMGSSGIDHRNGNGLDNRRENLRIASKSLNAHNTSSWASSGYKGVTRAGSKWKARIMKEGKNVHLGHFSSKEEAYEKYLEKAKELYGNDGLGHI